MRLSLLLRAVVIPVAALVALVVLIRPNHLPLPYIAPFLIGFVLFVDLATLARGGLQNACVVAATLAIGIAGLEAVLEWRQPRVVQASLMPLWALDPDLGYHAKVPGVFQARKTVDGHLAYAATYTIDDGLRRLTRSPAEGAKVRFFGDSYTFGEGLDDAETLPQRFADLTGANVLNYGYPGYGPAQALRALQHGLYDKDLAGAHLFVLQTAPFHVERTACKPDFSNNFPRYAEANGKLKYAGRCRPSPWQSSGMYQALFRAVDRRIGRTEVNTYIAIVNAFTTLARKRYHAIVVVLDMTRDAKDLRDSGLTSQDVEAAFRKAGALVIDGSVPTEPGDVLAIPFDGHPSATFDRLLARKLADVLKTRQPAILAPPADDKSRLAGRQASQ